MITLRRRADRGFADHGWLKSWHTFSFADYHDPRFMGFGDLRVINEDYIEGGQGFPTHGHRDMEILTYMISGTLIHKDTLGNSELLKAGEVQRMSAGQGIRHSEFNHLSTEQAHLLQIWILPSQLNLPPSYEQKDFSKELAKNEWTVLASNKQYDLGVAENAPLSINQNITVRAKKTGLVETTETLQLDPHKRHWIQVVAGELVVQTSHEQENKASPPLALQSGDALAITSESGLIIQYTGSTEVLHFELR